VRSRGCTSMIKQYKSDELDLDNSWIDELYFWADENNIPEMEFVDDDQLDEDGKRIFEGFWIGLPRDKDVLLNLEELNLSWHSCTYIPDQVRHLTKLKSFSFAKKNDGLQPSFYEQANNHLAVEEIPDWISELVNLEELDLSGNNIVYVPNVVGKLKKLKKLYLHENRIMFIEEGLGKLDKLEVLWLQWNKVAVLSDRIKQLQSLRELWFDGLEGSDYGPIERCPEGLKWWANDEYTIREISHKGHDCNELDKKSLAELIDLMGLWKEKRHAK
jgi:hypothetical protein